MDTAAPSESSLEDRFWHAIAAIQTPLQMPSKLEVEKQVGLISHQLHDSGDTTKAAFHSEIKKRAQSMQRHAACMGLYLDEVMARYAHALGAYKRQQNFTRLYRVYREVYRAEHYSPVYLHRRALENAVRGGSRFVVVEGEVGAGKSTQLPQYLADMDEFSESIILCTQPCRIAAQTLAKRVSEEFRAGSPQTAKLVCYASSWADISAHNPHICYLTEATLLKMLTSKYAKLIFQKIGAVVVDEVHERTLYTDMILGLLKTSPVCSHIRVIASSAILDQISIRQYFDNCPLITIHSGVYTVDIGYSKDDTNYLNNDIVVEALAQVLRIIKSYPLGDILCFLTSAYEVEKAKQQLKLVNNPSIIALCMYGRADPDDMKSAFEPTPPDMRKVIFATNVAETSLTMEGLTYVVDMGLFKTTVFDPKRNLSSLTIMPIAQSSANQRKAHIGRTGEGVCFRMYSERQFELFEKEKQPEIRQRSLDVALAYLLSLNIHPFQFPWLNPPDPDNLRQSFNMLKIHGAISKHSELSALPSDLSTILTPLGQLIVLLQMDAGTVAGIHYAQKQGILQAGIILAAVAAHIDKILCSDGDERDEFRENRMKLLVPGDELVTYYRIYLRWRALKPSSQRKWCLKNNISSKTLSSIHEKTQEMQKNLEGVFPTNHDQPEIAPHTVPTELLQKVLLCMRKDKFAVQLSPKEFLVCGSESDKQGITASLHPSSLLLTDSCEPADLRCVVFHKLFTTNRTYLKQLTPVTHDMVLDVCGRHQADFMQSWIRNKLVQIKRSLVSPKIQIELLGKDDSKKEALINELQCQDIENSYEDLTITLWASKSEAHRIGIRLDKLLSDIKSNLLKQSGILNLPGSNVSLLVGAGLNVLEIMPQDRILFESFPDEGDKETIENILSPHLNSRFKGEKVASCVVEVIRSKYFKGALVVFRSILLAERVKLLLERRPELLRGACGKWHSARKWYSARSTETQHPRISEISIVLVLDPTTWCRAFFRDRKMAEIFRIRSESTRDIEILQSDPRIELLQLDPLIYAVRLEVEPEDDERTIRSRYRGKGFPQPYCFDISGALKELQINPLAVFPRAIEHLVDEIGIPVESYIATYRTSFFTQHIEIEKHVDFPIQWLDSLEQGLLRLRTHGALEGIVGCHIHKTWSLRLTLPAELVQVRKECLENILADFESESFYNMFTLAKDFGASDDLIYDCYSDEEDSLHKLQLTFTSKICTPEKSEAVSPKLGQTELGRHLMDTTFRRWFPYCLLQNSILHIWTESDTTVGQCLKLIRTIEGLLDTAREDLYQIPPSQAIRAGTYLHSEGVDILHMSIYGDGFGIWAPPRVLEQAFFCLTQQFPFIEHSSDPPFWCPEASKPCALCGSTHANQAFTILDMCAHRFHAVCLHRYIEKEIGRNLICCPCCSEFITYPELVEVSKSIPYIMEKATELFFRIYCDSTGKLAPR